MSVAPAIVVGLGNPCAQYANTRHNAGFWFIDALAAQLGANFSNKAKFHGDMAIAGCRLLKPMTYMNLSGQSVARACQYFNIPAQAALIVHDDADLSLGIVKLKFGGSEAGHNGLADISRALDTKEYWRLRLGIGRDNRIDIADYVLGQASPEEREKINTAIRRALSVWQNIAAGDWQSATQILHTQHTEEKQENDHGN